VNFAFICKKTARITLSVCARYLVNIKTQQFDSYTCLLCDMLAVRCNFAELPVMVRVPFLRMRNDSSVMVWWREWRNPPDRGSGPVSAYVVYYRHHMETDWEALQQTTSTWAAVTGLRQDTEYQFRVAAVHQSGVVGMPSPMLTVSTCGSMYSGACNTS